MQEIEQKEGKKSRFGVVFSVIAIVLAMVFAFLVLSQKEKYSVLDNASKEVTSMISSIKDIRVLKGYKVIKEKGENKLVLISAGLSYDAEGKIEVLGVEFEKNSAKIIVKEQINKNPEKEKVTYPFVVVKMSSSISNISVVTEAGEKYEEIVINQHTNEGIENEENISDVPSEDLEGEQDDSLEDEIDVEDEENTEVSEEDEEIEEEVNNVSTKTLTCVYEGKADATTIEVSVGSNYKTFDISDVVGSFDKVEIGQQITIEYIDTLGNAKIVNVK